MSKSIAEIARHPARFGALLALVIMTLVVAAMNVSATPPSNFMEAGSTGGDKNVRDESAANPPFDWANSGTGAANTCPTATTGFTVVNLAGAGGLFNCGQGDGQFTTPIGPIPTADGTVGAHHIDASAFKVDPLASDNDTCIDPKTGLQTKDGDPTTYTKAGGEKNGDSLVLNSTGSDAVETWSTASVPPKDDVSNVYAVSRSGFDPSNPTSDAASGNGKEVFFGAERVVNNGDTHMDFEFTQAAVGLSAGSPPGTCAGKFDGHRTHGDFIASIDYTTGGSIGTFSLAQWHCNTDTHSSDNSTGWVTAATNGSSLNGKLCDFASGSTCTVASTPGVRSDGGFTCGTGPHYQEIACFDANGPATNPSCPGAGSGDPNSVCNPIPAGGCAPGVPLDAIRAVTNGGPSETPAGPGPVACGGWACRLSDGTTPTGAIGTCTASSCIDTNQLMEGSVNLLSLGFTRCIATFIPHTRSSQSFTATTKDFELIPFNTCTGAIRIEKVDESGPPPTFLSGACFSISGASLSTPLSVCDNDNGNTTTNTSDQDPAVGKVCVAGLQSGDYTVTETVVPAGYIGDPGTPTATVPGALTDNVVCPNGPTGSAIVRFVNKLGSLQWEKRSDIDGFLQDGATFNITPNPFDCHQPAGTNPSPISDDTDGVVGPGTDKDPDLGQFKLVDVCVTNLDGSARTYTITEVSAKTGFALDPDPDRLVPISASDANPVLGSALVNPPAGNTTGRDDCPDTTGIPDDDHTLGVAGTGADFCNPVGSLFWEKRAKNAGVGDTPLLGGATFKLNKNPHTGAAGDFTGIVDCIVPAVQANCNALEDKDPDAGQFCLSGVVFGAYTITETAAPTNYVKDGTPKSKTVDSSSTCAGTPTDAGDFINIPLSQIEVKFTSLAGANVTAASIVCADSTPATVGANSENGAADPALTITSNTAANPTVVTTSTPHGLTTGAVVNISGSNSTPSIDGSFPVTVLSPTTFSIPVNVTAAGTAGTASPLDDTDEVFGDGVSTLKPGTYTCTIVIDP